DRELAALLFALRNMQTGTRRRRLDQRHNQSALPRCALVDGRAAEGLGDKIDDLCDRLTGEDISAEGGQIRRCSSSLRRVHDRLPPTIASSADACTGSIYDTASNIIGTVTITTK